MELTPRSGAAMEKRGPRRTPRPARASAGERGSVLLAVVMMAAVAAAMTAAMLGRASSLASELRARRDVLCARYAALGGLALGAPVSDPVAAAALVGPNVDSLAVWWVRAGPAWCVLRASASCGPPPPPLDRTMPDVTPCTASTP